LAIERKTQSDIGSCSKKTKKKTRADPALNLFLGSSSAADTWVLWGLGSLMPAGKWKKCQRWLKDFPTVEKHDVAWDSPIHGRHADNTRSSAPPTYPFAAAVTATSSACVSSATLSSAQMASSASRTASSASTVVPKSWMHDRTSDEYCGRHGFFYFFFFFCEILKGKNEKHLHILFKCDKALH
jgi:hypothetical protein